LKADSYDNELIWPVYGTDVSSQVSELYIPMDPHDALELSAAAVAELAEPVTESSDS